MRNNNESTALERLKRIEQKINLIYVTILKRKANDKKPKVGRDTKAIKASKS